jgi:hypothetical protein
VQGRHSINLDQHSTNLDQNPTSQTWATENMRFWYNPT